MVDMRVEVPVETMRDWGAIAQGSRMLADILAQVGEPLEGSNFEQINGLYPFERSSDWCREFLSAGLEHMQLWADYVAPHRFHEEAEVVHRFRPVQTLSRASVEAASQAVWAMDVATPFEGMRRHLCLVLDDNEQQRKAAREPERKSLIKDARETLLKRVEGSINESEIGRFPGYMEVVKRAVATVAEKKLINSEFEDPEVVGRLWRASAGAAHGKRWPSLELQLLAPGREIAPGTFETSRIPDPEAITKILNLAHGVLRYGVLRFADYSGYEAQLPQMMTLALERLKAKATLKTEAQDRA